MQNQTEKEMENALQTLILLGYTGFRLPKAHLGFLFGVLIIRIRTNLGPYWVSLSMETTELERLRRQDPKLTSG